MEIAPTMFGEWEDLFAGRHSIGFSPVALQSIFFKTKHNLYTGYGEWLDHLNAVAAFSRGIGCPYLVVGSPAARLAPPDAVRVRPGGGISVADRELACALHSVATANPDIFLGLEANPVQYGANVAVNAEEALDIVKLVNLPNVVFHIDTGCLRLAGDDPLSVLESGSAYIKRGHISVPNLLPYDGSESSFISAAIKMEIGLSYEARPSDQGMTGLRNFIDDVTVAMR